MLSKPLNQYFLFLFFEILFLSQSIAFEYPIAASENSQIKITVNAEQATHIAINPANPVGVSHNQYTHFNVAPTGVQLDNHNANAQVIVNEVISRHTSVLHGAIEVLGKTADVIVANPNGIDCNGCGFKNVNRGVLTTGDIRWHHHQLDGFDVIQGNITINHKGLIDYGSKQVDLIALTAIVTGKLESYTVDQSLPLDNLNIIVGKNRVDYATLKTSAVFHESLNQEGLLDIAALGGMYAKKIQLRSTKQGVGINSAGVIHAIDELKIQADRLINQKGAVIASQAGALYITTHTDLDNAGTIYAKHNLSLVADPNVEKNSVSTLTNQPGAIIYAQGVVSLGHDCYLNEMGVCARNMFESVSSQVHINNHGTIWGNKDIYIQSEIFRNDVKDINTKEVNFLSNIKETYHKYIPGNLERHSLGYLPGVGSRNQYQIKTWLYETQYNDPDTLVHRPSVIAGKNLYVQTQKGSNVGGTLAASATVSLAALHPEQTSTFSNQALVRYLTVRDQRSIANYRCQTISCSFPYGRLVNQTFEDSKEQNRMVLESVGGIIQSGLWGHGVKIALGRFENDGAVEQTIDYEVFTPIVREGMRRTLSTSIQETDFFTHYFWPADKANFLFKMSDAHSPDNGSMEIGLGFFIREIKKQQGITDNHVVAKQYVVDSQFARQLVSAQALAKTGKVWLEPFYTDHQTQFHVLMNNALAVPGLELGVPLNELQKNALTTNIIWPIEKMIHGHKVLVPQLYLAPAVQAKVNGAQVIGHGIDLNVSVLNNRGGSLNDGHGALLNILARDKLLNLSGTIVGERVRLTTPYLLSQTLIHRYGDANDYRDEARRFAWISGLDEVFIQSFGNAQETGIYLKGAGIVSKYGNVQLRSDSQIVLESLAQEHKYTQWPIVENDSNIYTKQVALTAKVKAAEQLNVHGKEEVRLTGMLFKAKQIRFESQSENVDIGPLSLIQTAQTQAQKNITGWLSIQQQKTLDARIHLGHAHTNISFAERADIIANNGVIYIGDTDLRARATNTTIPSVLSMYALGVDTYRIQDVDLNQKKTFDSFWGIRFEGHSSIVDAVKHAQNALGASGSGKAYVRATVMRGAQIAGDVSNVAYSDTLGGSIDVAIEDKQSIADTQTLSDLVSNWSADKIFVTTKKSDITLRGVEILSENESGVIALNAAGKILIQEAEDATQWDTNSNTQQFTLGGAISANVLMAAAGVGLRVGYNDGKGYSTRSQTRHTPAHIAAHLVKLVSKDDALLLGGKITSKKVELDIGKSLQIQTLQDTDNSDTRQGSWGGTFGLDINAATFFGVNGGVQGNVGKDWQQSALTSQQSGIFANTIAGLVKSNLVLQGAHIIANQQARQDSLLIMGYVSAQSLVDSVDKDGFVAGAGVGMGVNGVPYSNIEISTPRMMKYRSEQHATLAGLRWHADRGISGSLNFDPAKLMTLKQQDTTEAIEIKGSFAFTPKHSLNEQERLPAQPAKFQAKKAQPCCFAPGTMVATPKGERAIETLKEGDWVWTRNDGDVRNPIFAAQVTATHQRDDQPIYRLVLNRRYAEQDDRYEALLVTPDHPFFAFGKGFVSASQLQAGDILSPLDAVTQYTKVVSIELDQASGRTHNLTVDRGHTFFVGAFQTWVHNTGDCVNTKWFVNETEKNVKSVQKYIEEAQSHMTVARDKLTLLKQSIVEANEFIRQKENAINDDERTLRNTQASEKLEKIYELRRGISDAEATILDLLLQAQTEANLSDEHEKSMRNHVPKDFSAYRRARQHQVDAKNNVRLAKAHLRKFESDFDKADFSGQSTRQLAELKQRSMSPTRPISSDGNLAPEYRTAERVSVDSKTYELLQIADDINHVVRRDLPLGAANQQQNLLDSYGVSAFRVEVMRKYLNLHYPKGSFSGGYSDYEQDRLDILRVARAGNCIEHAVLGYHHAVEKYGDKLRVQVVHDAAEDHVFVVLEHRGNTDPNKRVVLDTWAVDGGVHLLQHNKFRINGTLYDNVFAAKPAVNLDKNRQVLLESSKKFNEWLKFSEHNFPELVDEGFTLAMDTERYVNGRADNGLWNRSLTSYRPYIYQKENTAEYFLSFLPDSQRSQRMQVEINRILDTLNE